MSDVAKHYNAAAEIIFRTVSAREKSSFSGRLSSQLFPLADTWFSAWPKRAWVSIYEVGVGEGNASGHSWQRWGLRVAGCDNCGSDGKPSQAEFCQGSGLFARFGTVGGRGGTPPTIAAQLKDGQFDCRPIAAGVLAPLFATTLLALNNIGIACPARAVRVFIEFRNKTLLTFSPSIGTRRILSWMTFFKAVSGEIVRDGRFPGELDKRLATGSATTAISVYRKG